MQKNQQDQSQIKWIFDFIWNIADDRLRDVYVRGKYRRWHRRRLGRASDGMATKLHSFL